HGRHDLRDAAAFGERGITQGQPARHGKRRWHEQPRKPWRRVYPAHLPAVDEGDHGCKCRGNQGDGGTPCKNKARLGSNLEVFAEDRRAAGLFPVLRLLMTPARVRMLHAIRAVWSGWWVVRACRCSPPR